MATINADAPKRTIVNAIDARLVSEDGSKVGVQSPLPVGTESIYASDINVQYSDNGDFSGTITDYFNSLKSVNSDATSNDPKSIKLWFNRTIQTHTIGFGCDDLTKSFSNIKLKFLGSGEEVRFTWDGSADSTKRNSYLIDLPSLAANGVIIEFHTPDEIGLSNIYIPKFADVYAQLSAAKDDNTVVAIGATDNDNLRVSINEYGDTPAVDAFARLRVSDNFTLFDSKQLHDKQPLLWDESLGGSATSTHNSTNAAVELRTTASASDFVIRQTKQRFNYQPGKSQLCFMTFYSPQVSGVTNKIGYFDGTGTNNLTPNNGVFFQCDGDLSWNIAKNGVVTETASQDNWNVDKLDGTGASRITLDMSATHIMVIDFEWLGVGRVRVGFVIDGLIYYVHYFNHANNSSFTSVYMSSPNLPCRYQTETDGTNAGSLDHICSTIISEGGTQKTGVLRAVDTGSTHLDANSIGTTYAVVGIRLKAAYNDVTVLPESFSMISETNDNFRWSLHLNPTIAGTFTYSDIPNSGLQSAIGVTANTVSSDGVVFTSGYASTTARSAEGDLQTALKLGSTIDGTVDELVLCVTPLSANADIQASLNIRELL